MTAPSLPESSVPAPSLQADYEAIEAAVMETEKGRWFLAEYARRHRAADTAQVLAAIGSLERVLKRERRPDIDRIRLDIGEMKDAIERTKLEIAQIKQDPPAGSSRFEKASNELDAIVSQTETATSEILGAAEKIQEYAFVMREAGVDEAICDEVESLTTTIYMACSFQDLTGQRTQKVVHVLRYLESRIDAMIEIWGMGEETLQAAVETPANPFDTRPDAHLLNGPQMEGEGVAQSLVDDMFGTGAVDPFDALGDLDDLPTAGHADDAADNMAFDAIVAEDDDAAEAMAAEAFAGPDDVTEADDGSAADALVAAVDDADEALTADGEGVEAEVTLEAEASADEAGALDVGADSVDGGAEDAVLARAAEAMEEAIGTLKGVSEVVGRDKPAAEDPLARLSRSERQALFS
ncbi:protein phosphatase CheZ [Mongoliimonas terrestris]|uniref:protein phosphatase CheZ n=1 Tax=Mongoliimonas terrestris TaxID=1709001 RepID=UPI000949699A|nr:protein phosphatase CheZ [Mongoliimonas terrestris]